MMNRVRRSLLISPAHRADMLEKLAASAADVCVLELEDGVHIDKKMEARHLAAEGLRDLDWRGRERLVRVNRVTSNLGEEDVSVVAAGEPDAILLPKVEHESEVLRASTLLASAEERANIEVGSIGIWSMIESAKGLARVEGICEADSRIEGVIFGGGDLGADLRVKRLALGANRLFPLPAHEYLYARGRVVAAARASGASPIDVGFSSFGDLEGTRNAAEISAQMGFSGAIVFHPRQVPLVNQAFSPTPDDIKWATEVMDAFREVGASSGTVTVVDGEMVDGPFVRNAEDILALADAIAGYDKIKEGH